MLTNGAVVPFSGRFTVGVVGCGEIVWNLHLPVLLNHPWASVAWLTDRDPEKARKAGRSFGIRHAVFPESPADLPDADVVLLAIPYGVREPYYTALGPRGTAVYVEKPFARRLSEHDEYCRRFAPGRLAVGFQRRSSGFARLLRDLISSGVLGNLRKMTFEFGEPGIRTGGRYSSNLRMAGGGILFEVGCHVLDLLLFVSEAVHTEPRSIRMERHKGFDIETVATMDVFDSTGRSIELSFACTNLRSTSMEIVLEFDTAVVTAPVGGDTGVTVAGLGPSPHLRILPAAGTYPETAAQMAAAHWRAFLGGVQTGKPNLSSAQATRVTTAVLQQLYGAPSGA